MVVYTLGHSTLALDAFLALLRAHDLTGLVDVRRFPASRRHPHFGGDALAASLAGEGISYAWIPQLGGRRTPRRDSPHVGWRVEGFRGYADHMETREFADGLARLLVLAAERRTAVLCAEAVPWRCHRRLLADALLARGVEVRHVMSATKLDPHELTAFARVDGERVVYDRGTQTTLLGGD